MTLCAEMFGEGVKQNMLTPKQMSQLKTERVRRRRLRLRSAYEHLTEYCHSLERQMLEAEVKMHKAAYMSAVHRLQTLDAVDAVDAVKAKKA